MFPISGTVQSYAWGKVGAESLVAQLKKTGCDSFEVDSKNTYAEHVPISLHGVRWKTEEFSLKRMDKKNVKSIGNNSSSVMDSSGMTTAKASALYQITTPEGFNFNNPSEWTRWKRRFERFRTASGLSTQPSEEQLWMGTHPSGPAVISCPELKMYDGNSLENWLKDHQDAIGMKSKSTQLPFLLKVLSVNKALSIQAHPNKKHAEELHEGLPNIYKDPNHKPEMAIALTEFQALCGFRPFNELQALFKDIPELIKVVGEENSNLFLQNSSCDKSTILQKTFKDLMTCPESTYQPVISSLLDRLKHKDNKLAHEFLFLRICEDFPGDIGCLGLFFFNYLTLEPGQAIYLAANEPHAYLKGDCVECMACSDNVVRAGLTPKLKDVETLCSMLTYKMKSVDENIFKGIEESQNTILFKPEVPDFALVHIKMSVPEETLNIKKRDSASIILVVEGEGTLTCTTESVSYPFGPGSIFFVSCGLQLEIKNLKQPNLSIFQAFSFM